MKYTLPEAISRIDGLKLTHTVAAALTCTASRSNFQNRWIETDFSYTFYR